MKITHQISLLIALAFAALSTQEASAQSFNWGGTVTFSGSQQTYFDSGGTPLDSTNYTFSVGYFNTGFAPTDTNIGSWNSNWNMLGSDMLDNSIPWTFGGTDFVLSSASNGQNAYMWVYDALGQTGSTGGQAFLGTGSWALPTFGSILPADTFEFSNMTSVIYGRTDTNFGSGGAGGILTGGGTITSEKADNTFEAQLGTVPVPEPSGALLISATGLALILRRRRHLYSAC